MSVRIPLSRHARVRFVLLAVFVAVVGASFVAAWAGG